MAAFKGFGLVLIIVLICRLGRTSALIPEDTRDQEIEASENSFSFQIPIGGGNVIQSDTQISPERRLSLEDFFLNSNSNTQKQDEPVLQAPVAQFQVQQPDPNSLFLVRDAQFPSPTGGLISRLLLARRMLRLRRIARRITFIPRLLGLGLTRSIARSARIGPNPLSLIAKRTGEAYDPRDYVFGNKAFSYKDNASDSQQQDASNDPLQQQQTRELSVGAQPYYDSYDEGNYDILDNSNIRGIDSYENQDLSLHQNAINSLSNEQQLLLLQQLQKYQEQLNQLQHQLNQQQYNVPNNPIQEQHPLKNQAQRQNYENSGQNGVSQNQQQLLTDKQLEQVRQLQLELLKEQQLQQQELQQQLQQLQLAQQAHNLKLSSAEQDRNYNNQNNQQPQPVIPNQSVSAAGRTEGSPYSPPFNLGATSGGNYGPGAGTSIGVGVNVGIKPPEVDIQVTKPGSPIIKPFPPIVNPIGPKPVPVAPAEPGLVPLGILPKPILNLKGRVFFGAEMGKNAGVQVGR